MAHTRRILSTISASVLELAAKAGKVIFSAAGNDSSGLAVPMQARYASPFNWAALTAREHGIARNGVVVEAHDASNKRAPFSNVGGNVSCPGVDVSQRRCIRWGGKFVTINLWEDEWDVDGRPLLCVGTVIT